MALQGNLRDMSVADIIQVNCQDKKIALATISNNGKDAKLYFQDGAVVHAELENILGEEVIYQILAWNDGEFTLDIGVPAPQVTIRRNWSGLLLEGAKRLDESANDLDNLLQTGAPIEKKDEQIKQVLDSFISKIVGVDAVAIVGIDGFVKYSNYKNIVDDSIFGAVGAAIFNLGKRSLGLLRMDNFNKSWLVGENNTLFVMTINKYTLLIAMFTGVLVNTQLNNDQIDRFAKEIQEFS